MIAFIIGIIIGLCLGLIVFYLIGNLKDDCQYMSKYEDELFKNQSLKRMLKLKEIEIEAVHELLIETQEVLRGKNEKTA